MLKLTRTQWLAGLLGALTFAQDKAQDKKVKQFTADELKELLANEKNLFFLDVREPKEIEELGSIQGYVNIPVSQVESRLSEIPKDKVIITACARGVRAARAADVLIRNGYKVVGACGLMEWKAKDYPVVYPKGDAKKK